MDKTGTNTFYAAELIVSCQLRGYRRRDRSDSAISMLDFVHRSQERINSPNTVSVGIVEPAKD